jgi:hypothetical protein
VRGLAPGDPYPPTREWTPDPAEESAGVWSPAAGAVSRRGGRRVWAPACVCPGTTEASSGCSCARVRPSAPVMVRPAPGSERTVVGGRFMQEPACLQGCRESSWCCGRYHPKGPRLVSGPAAAERRAGLCGAGDIGLVPLIGKARFAGHCELDPARYRPCGHWCAHGFVGWRPAAAAIECSSRTCGPAPASTPAASRVRTSALPGEFGRGTEHACPATAIKSKR